MAKSRKAETSQGLPATAGNAGWLLWVFLLASALGLVVSIYLSVLHWQVNNQPGHVSFCAVSEKVNCDTVALSRYSVILGMPISTWGILFYLGLCFLAWWGKRAKASPWPWGILAPASAAALGFSVYLFAVAEWFIGSLCLMCCALYLVNLANAVLALLALRKLRIASARGLLHALQSDLVFLFKKPALGGGLSALVVMAVAAGLLATRLLYPEVVFAGGIQGLATGHTPEGRNWIGADNPRLVITEFSDYECPFCSMAHKRVREVVRERKEWVRLVHVHLPLDNSCNRMLQQPMHRFACICARAAICADRQGRFWDMNDALFARRGGLDAGGLTMLAQKMGLDADRFRDCLRSADSEQELQQDIGEAIRRRFNGTPTFLVGDAAVMGVDGVIELIQRELAPVVPPGGSNGKEAGAGGG